MGLILRDPDKVLASEAGRILNLTPQRVAQLVDSGKLPARRVLGVRIIPRKAVEALAKERERKRKAAFK